MSIPKIIHQIWIGPPEPERITEYRETWRQYHPDWDYWLWGDAELTSLDMVNRDLYMQAARCSSAGRVHQFRADIARYEILARYGGLYVDADFECQHSMDELMEDVPAWLAWEKQDVWLSNAIFASMPGHPFVTALRDGLRMNVRRVGRSVPTIMSGPQYITPVWRDGDYPDVVARDQERFFPYRFNELYFSDQDYPNAWAVHHWGNRRRMHRVPFPETAGRTI